MSKRIQEIHQNTSVYTWQSILGFKESTESSFHTGQTALILLTCLLFQISHCQAQLLKTSTEGTEKKNNEFINNMMRL